MSRRLSALNAVLRRVARPILVRTGTPENAERDFALAARVLFRPPRGVAADRKMLADRIPALCVRGPDAEGGCAILYFHGGGYVAGSARTHAGLAGRIARSAGVEATCADYRLAQTAPAPAAFEDAVAVWDVLVAEGAAPGRIVLGGDSAGGGLALALLAHLCARGTPPAGLFAFSPWTDLALTGGSIVANAATDALLPAERIEELTGIVLGGTKPSDPRISPLYADFRAPPPVYLQASRTEILLDDTLRMAERLRQAGGDVSIDLWDDAPHVWHIFGDWLPEARDAIARAAGFVRTCLRLPPRPAGS